MYTDFNEASAKAGKSGVSYQLYRRVVADMNIGFTKLGEEACEIWNLKTPSHHLSLMTTLMTQKNVLCVSRGDNTSRVLDSAE